MARREGQVEMIVQRAGMAFGRFALKRPKQDRQGQETSTER
jgi:hypothetical protein